MITPNELKERMKESQFEKDMKNALEIVNKKIETGLQNGDIKIMLPSHMPLGNLFYSNDKEKAIAERLIKLGYKCKRESDVIGGVRQNPIWYLYFH